MSSVSSFSGTGPTIPPVPVRRFTVDEYHRMIEVGILHSGDPFELLEGWIVPKMRRSPPHNVALVLAEAAIDGRLPANWHRRGQSAVTTTESEPEPDLAVVKGRRRDYHNHHPGPQDVALAIEVADSSLQQDRTVKARIYARAAIPVYWIVNVVDRQVEAYADPTGPDPDPTYRQRRDYLPGDSVPFLLDGVEMGPIPVCDLLP